LKNNFNEDEIQQIINFISTINNEKEYYEYMFHLVCNLRFSIEELVEFYNGSTFDDIKSVLIEKFNMEFKWCRGCNKTRSITSFTRQSKTNSYYRSRCKICIAKEKKQYRSNPEIRQKHIDYMKEYNPIYHSENKEQLRQIHHDYYESNKEILLQNQKKYYQNHTVECNLRSKEYMKDYRKTRIALEPMFRLRAYFSTRMYQSLKGNKHGMSWEKLVGYTLQDLKTHLESKFDDKMNWDNYGSYWHIDHIVAVALFNYTSYDDEAFKRCWCLQNLQPLYGPDNLEKSDIISEKWNNVELAAQLLS